MKHPWRSVAIVAAILVIAALAGPGSADAQTRVVAINQADAVAMINALRRQRGLPPVTADARLQQAARTHSVWMATRGKVSHSAGLGGGLGAKVRRVKYPAGRAWENIAAGQKSLGAAIESWMKSSGHRKNLLSRSAVHMGIAAASNPKVRYGTYWTLILAEPARR